MSDFEFRLQRVLDYRQMVEKWAKDAYLDARALKLEAIAGLEAIGARRRELGMGEAPTLPDRKAVEACLHKLKSDEVQQELVIQTLEHDEASRKEEWLEARKELQTLVKLRDAAFAEWMKAENRREQKELDEWSLQRRTA